MVRTARVAATQARLSYPLAKLLLVLGATAIVGVAASPTRILGQICCTCTSCPMPSPATQCVGCLLDSAACSTECFGVRGCSGLSTIPCACDGPNATHDCVDPGATSPCQCKPKPSSTPTPTPTVTATQTPTTPQPAHRPTPRLRPQPIRPLQRQPISLPRHRRTRQPIRRLRRQPIHRPQPQPTHRRPHRPIPRAQTARRAATTTSAPQ